MQENMNEFCVFVLLVLASLSESKPLQRVRRTIVKDYFNPLTYPTDKLQFEKGEDGKYHEQKHADSILSRVEYAVAHDIDASNEILEENLKSSEQTLKAGEDVVSNAENPNLGPESSKFELQKERIDLSTKVLGPDELKTEVKEKVSFPETTAKLDSETEPEDESSKAHETSAKLDIPVDSKWTLVPKPDGKDDKPYEGGEEYLPEPPIAPEEKDDEGKVEIGEIPKHHPVFVPPSIPLFIPKRISFRMLSMLPKPPTIDISDRLPLSDPEVIEESSETAVVENISPHGPMVIKEGRRYFSNHFINPLRIGLQLPFSPAPDVLKETFDEEKLKGLAKSEIVDIGGHKMLLQRKILMSPHRDPSQMHISVMSIQPLEHVDPKILKEIDVEKKELESEEARLEKDLEHDERKEAEKRSLKSYEVGPTVKKEGKKGKEVFRELLHRPEIHDAEKTGVNEEKPVDAKMLPPDILAPAIPEMAIEANKKAEEEDAGTKEFELKAKTKHEEAEKTEKGMETEIESESKLKTDVEKNKDLEILPSVHEEKREEEKTSVVVKGEKDLLFVPEEKKEEEETSVVVKEEKDLMIVPEEKKEEETSFVAKEGKVLSFGPEEKKEEDSSFVLKEGKDLSFGPEEKKEGGKHTAVVKDEKDLLIGTEDLLKFRNQMKTQTSTGEHPLKSDIGVDLMEREEGFEKENQTKDEEVAESKSVEVTLKPAVESKFDLEEVITEGKKGDEGILPAEEAAASHSRTKFTEGKDTKLKTDILKDELEDLEKSVIGGEKDEEENTQFRAKEAVASHSGSEVHTSGGARQKTDVMKIESKEESKIKGKKGDDEMLSTDVAGVSHVATEVVASKEAKEKTDIRSLQHSEESSPKIEDFGLTKTEGAILEERKKKFDERKKKVTSKKRKCKCEDSEESDSDDEDDLD